jgi:hypothetical protein
MNNRQYFRDWFVTVLDDLYSNGNAGFPILMIVFPLLERYLREKSGTHENSLSNNSFYLELRKIFPELINDQAAKNFWETYRHGLLHQVTVSLKNRKGVRLPSAWLSNDFETIEVDKAGNFCVHPAKFAKRTIETIEKDFDTFEGKHSPNHPLSTVFDIGISYQGTASPGATFNDWSGPPRKKGG